MKEVPLKILIVEDSDSDVELIVRELKNGNLNFSFNHCKTQEKFEKLLVEFDPDLILSDHNLPSFNSVDALVQARRYKPQIPFILISGFIRKDEAIDMIVNKGADDFILKDNLLRLNPAIIREIKNYRLKAELEYKTKELKRLSMVASHTHNGVIISNKKGEIEWVNKACTELTGYTLNECFGQKPGHFLQGKDTDPKTVERISAKLKKQVSFSEEILNYHKRGAPYWIKLDITPIIDGFGELTNFIAIQENITERKEFEFDLIKTNQRLEQAQKIGEIGNWDFDIQSEEVTWSNQVFEIYERNPALGNPTFEELKKYHPNDISASKIIKESLSKGKAYNLDTELITKKGSIKYIRTVGIPVKNNGGEVIRFTGVVQDITSRKKIENELILNESKLKSITDCIPGVVFRYKLFSDGRDKIEYISEGVEKTFEITAKEAIEDTSFIWDLVLKEDKDETKASVRKSAKDYSIWKNTYRIKTKSGQIKWLRGVGVPKFQDEESTVWDTILLDVTKEMENEHSLVEANKRLLEAQKLAKIGDWSMDFISKKTYISPMLKEIHEVAPEFEFDIETGLSFFKEGFDRDQKREVVERAISEGTPYNEELKLITAQGKEKWVRSIGEAVLKQGKCIRLYGTIMDITDKKEKELAILKSEERLEAAVAGADLGLWDLNLATEEYHANGRWFEMLGYKPDEAANSLEFFKSIMHPNDADMINKEVQRIENGGENNLDIILRLKGSDEEYKRISTRGKVVEFDDLGRAKRLVGTHLDITDSLELQESLSKSLDEKTVLLSEIHHRVKNNLAVVSGLLELQAMESNDAELNQTLNDMAKRIKSIAGVHELLYDSKSFSEISFKKYVSNLFQSLDVTLMENFEVNLDLDIEDDLAVNINQAVPLGLLINELVTNSYKYAFNRTRNPKIRFAILFDGEKYNATYFDNGLGFDKKEFDSPSSLGFTLVKTLLAQLSAEYELNTDNQFKLSFSFAQKVSGSHSNL